MTNIIIKYLLFRIKIIEKLEKVQLTSDGDMSICFALCNNFKHFFRARDKPLSGTLN